MKHPSHTHRSIVHPRRSLLHRTTVLALLVSFSLFTGWTAVGYDAGFRNDLRNAEAKPVEELSRLEEGDWVKLKTTGYLEFTGHIRSLARGDSLALSYLKSLNYPVGPRLLRPGSWSDSTFAWSSIQTVERLEVRPTWRILQTAGGLVGDASLVVVALIAYLLHQLRTGPGFIS